MGSKRRHNRGHKPDAQAKEPHNRFLRLRVRLVFRSCEGLSAHSWLLTKTGMADLP